MHEQDGIRVVSVCDSMGKVKLRRQQGALGARVTLCLVLVARRLQADRQKDIPQYLHPRLPLPLAANLCLTGESCSDLRSAPVPKSPTTRTRNASAASSTNMLAAVHFLL